MSSEHPSLRWKRVAVWDLSQREQILFIADGCDVQYKVSRSGTADKPRWRLYTRLSDGIEERQCLSNRLRDIKFYASYMEDLAPAAGAGDQ